MVGNVNLYTFLNNWKNTIIGTLINISMYIYVAG